MSSKRVARGLWVALALSVSAARADKPVTAYVWPQLPSKETLETGASMGGERGLVVLERRCKLEVHSFGVKDPGTRREEFLRILVTSDDGRRNAKVGIDDVDQASIEVIEGRTVAPDGTITELDEKRDVVRISVTAARSRETSFDLATILFPAPAKGAIFDLHFITKTNIPPVFYFRSLLFERLATLSTDFDVTMEGGLMGVGWSVMTLGETHGAVRSEYKQSGQIMTHMSAYTPPELEPLGLPPYHWEPLLLCYLNLASLHGTGIAKGERRGAMLTTNGRGIVQEVDFSGETERSYWRSVVDGVVKVHDEYVKSPGAAKKVRLEEVAPASLPLEERVRRIHGWVQEHVVFNPDAEMVYDVGSVVKKGMRFDWQATLVLSSLLERAGIHREVGVAISRYGLRFSPVFYNAALFPGHLVLKVDVPGKAPLFLTAGMPTLPMGALPDLLQESLVLLPSGEKSVSYEFTRPNPPGSDARTFGYSLVLDGSGDVSGTVTLDETGAPAVDFASYNRDREYRLAHPVKKKEVSEADERRRAAWVEKQIQDELDPPGDLLQLQDWKIEPSTAGPPASMRLSAAAHGKGLAQRAQDRWLLYINPLMAGWVSPFSKPGRGQPIWYPNGGKVVLEGEIKLPAGAAILELPKPMSIEGPENTHATSTVTRVEKGGACFIKSRLEFDQPYIVSRDAYTAWSAFQASLARAGQDRCVITMSETKELE